MGEGATLPTSCDSRDRRWQLLVTRTPLPATNPLRRSRFRAEGVSSSLHLPPTPPSLETRASYAPPSKTSIGARFRRWFVVFHHHHLTTFENVVVFHLHHPTTVENEHTRSFSTVVRCFPSPSPHHLQKRACELVFEGGCLFATSNTSAIENEHASARFRWRLLFSTSTSSPPSKTSTRVHCPGAGPGQGQPTFAGP
jgi:hypothetical protein